MHAYSNAPVDPIGEAIIRAEKPSRCSLEICYYWLRLLMLVSGDVCVGDLQEGELGGEP